MPPYGASPGVAILERWSHSRWRAAFDDLMQHRAVGKVCIDVGTAVARL